MKKIIVGLSILTTFTCCNNSNKDAKQNDSIEKEKFSTPKNTVENFLNTPEMISLTGTNFDLAWSSHPTENYYKQEYIPQNNTVDKYKQMIMVEFATGNIAAKDAVAQKIQELNDRKSTDKLVKYQVSENKEKNEILLDFMLSEGNGDANTIVEWNAYRYSNYTDKTGKKGLYLFALSKREYGQDIVGFVSDLKANRLQYVSDFVALTKPEINLK